MITDQPGLTTIDELVEWCGHHYTSRTNNGYGCRHPDQQDRDPLSGEGRCFTFSCPFGTQLMPDSDPEDREWIEELGYNPDGLTDEGNWMVLDKKPRRIVRLPILGNES